ncbi:Possible periplasmic protein [hydrothermal vent metagenome]|uniref:Possible periplasmic protein n=1 Tax=hydrothermal vent metagenome TaxID=652676 RepID=A0A1W1EHW7_9ZZZZ
MFNFKNITLAFLLIFSFSEAKVLNGVSIIVEDEPITTAEIQAVQHRMRISKKKAIDILIQSSLQKSVSKDINVGEDEINAKIAQIASINKLTIKKMQSILKKQGMKWYDYRQRIKTEMKKQKFYQTNIAPLIPIPGDDQLKLFYKKNRKLFKMPTRVTMIEYSAKDIDTLKHFIADKRFKKGISQRSVTKTTKDGELFDRVVRTPIGAYTKPINAGDRYIVYKIKSKQGSKILPYDKVKNGVIRAWKYKQREKATKDYFKKLRTSAIIEYVR